MHGDLDDDFDLLGSNNKQPINIDEIALRAARREPPPEPPKKPKGPSLAQRLKRGLSLVLSHTAAALKHSLVLSLVTALSLAAVSYGLDPEHVLDDVALERASAQLTQLKAQVSGVFSH